MQQKPPRIEVANQYTGPRLKHFAIVTAVVVPLVFVAVWSRPPDERTTTEAEQERKTRIAARAHLVSQPLDLNSKAAVVRGGEMYQTIKARVKAIDAELRNWQVSGRPEDIDRRRTLQAERKLLTGEGP
jgi:hypothetical protein